MDAEYKSLEEFLSEPPISTEVLWVVQEADTDGAGNEIGWCGWSSHDTFEEAEKALWSMRQTEGRLRVARETTETFLIRDCPNEPDC